MRGLSTNINSLAVLILARLPLKSTGTFFILSSVLVITLNPVAQKEVVTLGESLVKSRIITESFREEIQEIPFGQKQVPDQSLAIGESKVLHPGKAGEVKRVVRSLAFHGSIFTKDIVKTISTAPQDKILAFGTKRAYSTLETPKGTLHYWAKLRVYSTSYDSKCPGCNETTATGLKTGYGVVAVDPKTIPLGTKLYIPGYGLAVAGDTGGSIKGNKIDLGFDDVKKGWWSARFTDVYLLSEN